MISAATDDLRAHAGSDPADDRHGNAPVLSHDELGCRGDLVRDAHLGRHELTTVRVEAPAEIDDGGDAVATDRHVDDAASPRTPEGVGDDHGDPDACER